MDRLSGSLASCQYLARIQDALRVQGALQGAHHRQLHRVGAGRELRRLQPADAVLGADAAAEALDQVEDGRLERLRRGRGMASSACPAVG